jgi:hypothetical protein
VKDGTTDRRAVAHADMMAAAAECCAHATRMSNPQLQRFGPGVVGALDQVASAGATGDITAIENTARLLADAVTLTLDEMTRAGDPGADSLAFMGAVLTLRRRLGRLSGANDQPGGEDR